MYELAKEFKRKHKDVNITNVTNYSVRLLFFLYKIQLTVVLIKLFKNQQVKLPIKQGYFRPIFAIYFDS